MSKYRDSQRASAESFVRRCIRKAAKRTPKWRKDHPNGFRLTQNEAAVLIKLANMAMYWHPVPMHPGVKKLSDAAGLSIRVVQRLLRKFELEGFLIPVGHVKGGRGKGGIGLATDFSLDLELLTQRIEPLPNVAHGELVRLFRTCAELHIEPPSKGDDFASKKGDDSSPFEWSKKGDDSSYRINAPLQHEASQIVIKGSHQDCSQLRDIDSINEELLLACALPGQEEGSHAFDWLELPCLDGEDAA